MKRTLLLLAGFVTLIIVILLAIFFARRAFLTSKLPALPSPPPAGQISLKGTMVCLPHINTTGPQTTECAFGLKDESGRYYGLHDTDPTYKNVQGIGTNVTIQVEGTFRAQRDNVYPIVGLIDVTKITKQ